MAQTTRSTYLLDCSDAELEQAFNRAQANSITDEDDCTICLYACNKPGCTNKLIVTYPNNVITIAHEKGYPKSRLSPIGVGSFLSELCNGKGPMEFCSHIAYMYNNKKNRHTTAFKAQWIDNTMDISHRCGKPRCIARDCILLENSNVNKTRDFCHGINNALSCPHLPKCKVRLFKE